MTQKKNSQAQETSTDATTTDKGSGGTVERRVLGLAVGASVFIVVFVACFIWMQNSVKDNARQNDEVAVPIRDSVQQLVTGLNAIAVRQGALASARTGDEVSELASRLKIEQDLAEAEAKLRKVLPRLEDTNPEIRELEEKLAATLIELLATDAKYYNAIASGHALQDELALQMTKAEGSLRSFLESVQGMSGVIRFRYGSSLRRINRWKEKEGYSARVKDMLEREVLTSSSLRNGLVASTRALASELYRLVGEVGLVSNEDQLRSLGANELLPTLDRLRDVINEFAIEIQDIPSLSETTAALASSVASLRSQVQDPANSDSLMSLRARLLGLQKEANNERRIWEGKSADVLAISRTLESITFETTTRFGSEMKSVVSTSQWLLIILSAVAFVGLAWGAKEVRTSLRDVRATNEDLRRLQKEQIALNKNLERIVEERTQQIRIILDNVKFGFLICDKDGIVQDGYTRSCEALLDESELAGRDVKELLGLGTSEALNFEANYSQVYDDFLPEDLLFQQLPHRFHISQRAVDFQGSAIRDSSGEIAQVLFCLVDITTLEKIERENTENRTLMHLFKNTGRFANFISEVRNQLVDMRIGLKEGRETQARRELHTLKGNLGVFGLEEQALLVHAVEEQSEISAEAISRIEASIRGFLDKHEALLDISLDDDPVEHFRVTENDLDTLESKASEARTLVGLQSTLQEQLFTLRLKPALDLMGPLHELCASLADRCGKRLDLKISGASVKMLPESVNPIFGVLPHLLRNAIDHGIEESFARGEKPAAGTVEIGFADGDKGWTITVADDGKGIDLNAVRKKAAALGKINPDDFVKHSDMVSLIFADNLSTKEEVSEVSGRGVGMAAVAEAARLAGGRIDVETNVGVGTTFKIFIPYPRERDLSKRTSSFIPVMA